MRSTAAGLPHGFRIDHHRHPWHQLIFSTSGLMTVDTPRGHWVVPPQSAVWLPADGEHAIVFSGTSELRTLYLRPNADESARPCCAMSVSPLLRELVLRTVAQGALDDRVAADRAVAVLIHDELRSIDAPPLELPRPRAHSLGKLARLLDDPAHDALTTPRLARKVGMGVRTLERRFLADTGMTLYEWRRHARMLRALEHLLMGETLETTAERSGYNSASAFIAAFRTTFGTSPRRYVAQLAMH